MPNLIAIQLAEALAAEINGHTWSYKPEAFTAVRKYYAKIEDGGIRTVGVYLIPTTQTDINETRGKNRTDVVCWLDVQRLCTDKTSTSEVDGYVNFMEELKDFYSDNHRLVGMMDYWIEEAVYFSDQFWDPNRLYDDEVFEAAIVLTIRGLR